MVNLPGHQRYDDWRRDISPGQRAPHVHNRALHGKAFPTAGQALARGDQFPHPGDRGGRRSRPTPQASSGARKPMVPAGTLACAPGLARSTGQQLKTGDAASAAMTGIRLRRMYARRGNGTARYASERADVLRLRSLLPLGRVKLDLLVLIQ